MIEGSSERASEGDDDDCGNLVNQGVWVACRCTLSYCVSPCRLPVRYLGNLCCPVSCPALPGPPTLPERIMTLIQIQNQNPKIKRYCRVCCVFVVSVALIIDVASFVPYHIIQYHKVPAPVAGFQSSMDGNQPTAPLLHLKNMKSVISLAHKNGISRRQARLWTKTTTNPPPTRGIKRSKKKKEKKPLFSYPKCLVSKVISPRGSRSRELRGRERTKEKKEVNKNGTAAWVGACSLP